MAQEIELGLDTFGDVSVVLVPGVATRRRDDADPVVDQVVTDRQRHTIVLHPSRRAVHVDRHLSPGIGQTA